MKTASPRPVPVPANIEVEARLAGPFTARQCAILAISAAFVLAEGEVLHTILGLSPVVVVGAVAPVVFAGCLLALVRPGGVPADRLLRGAIRYARTGRRRADVPEHLPLPAGIARLAPLYRRIAELDGTGVVELDGLEAAVVIEAQPRCLQLADADEARAALAAIGTVLSAHSGPFSISTLTERVSLDERAQVAAEVAEHLSTPQLADLARRQATYLRGLADGGDLWRRRHLITVREAGAGAAARAAHRARAAAQLFEACGIKAHVLDPAESTALLTVACAPERSAGPRRLAPPGRPITAGLEILEQE
ncbi:PrgI family protein [Actinospica durhamensis]|uniref:PrgI family protein n=1 Tax=Actinospica durhamensis TaxID=1508375 RepID=A0A941IS16_9ACTN|nr:PrgI family protein [Actinospica durhamensis]MBR7839430.1 PrgI family protein [Actinospica durhamensis]